MAAWHPPVAPGTTGAVSLDGRPFQLHVPAGYDPAKKVPLVVLLHGYGSSAAQQERYFNLTPESDRRGFLYAMPDGTIDREGKRFWNATEACCDDYRSGVDDVAYLERLLDTVESVYSVDTARVYLVGHSNGGFMAYQMACERSTRITAIVSLAGAVDNDTTLCTPQRPVSVLEIHGTADATIRFDGGTRGGHPYPSVDTSLATWRHIDGCSAQADTSAPALDLEPRLPGAETGVTIYSVGCRDATSVELWHIRGGGHTPTLNATFGPAVIDFLYPRLSRP
ncbi:MULTISPECIES: PHB depolymerase family esterase [Micromonospora]|uniref:alpha/beta hydrolase family esterase n=1 Tax=Micromonospora TaxID=1873 RepID=UPI001319F8C6|nr:MULTISPECIES: alpha/beta fold hydrolase [Micromonospora]NES15126.1 alpha/beta fold hydrolase [Micromonospora sp. PPF5-17B]NES36867.1 alpha/beta fold hydrolase [Micromonospora solifontis]NES56461.1 alpha/beta fold hydrolase [Micromonospora sp. PPF5-6]